MSPIVRVRSSEPFATVEEAIEADWRWFAEHPGCEEYIREFCPGECDGELPELPPGFRYATLVSVTHRIDGIAVGRG
jgi:hypothetical protein